MARVTRASSISTPHLLPAPTTGLPAAFNSGGFSPRNSRSYADFIKFRIISNNVSLSINPAGGRK